MVSKIIGAFAMIAVFILLTAGPAMLLWNYCLVPAVSFAKEVTFFQMIGICILCNVLFKTVAQK